MDTHIDLFDIADFLPKYPNINQVGNVVMDAYTDNPGFYQTLYNKKEFNELTLEPEEQRPPPGKPYKHQEAIARFLSSYTLYNALLLDHEMGTGKSCSAFSAIENIKNTSNAFKGALVLTRGPRILSNLMKELVYVCTAGQYRPSELDRKLTENERKRRLSKLTSDYYTFNTFEKFSKATARMPDEQITKTYSNMIIVIDEVHNLRIREESQSYAQIHRLLHKIKNCKIIIMSGTPMKDDPSEIAAILNLILPSTQQLPTGKDFKDVYLNQHGEGLSTRYSVKPDKIASLKQTMKGYVSYLKSMTSNVKVEYAGVTVKPLEQFKVVPSIMSDVQTTAYQIAYKKDIVDKSDITLETTEESGASGIYSNSRQASLFIFPNGTSGKDGFSSYFEKIERGQIFQYKLKGGFSDFFRGANNEETLNKIRQYSCTYASIIKTILDNPTKLHFVYNSFVHGSGAVVLGKLLQLFGFSVASGNDGDKRNRYAILTNATASQQTVNNIISRFNSPQNMHGDYIKVIIGSKILSEGITLKNVQSIHVATPHWNYSELAQAIARGIRLESHRDLIEAGEAPLVMVYQHVAIPNKSVKVPSIDLQMYVLCESKDISIKAIERLMKESAVDCAIFYKRNVPSIHARDGDRECDYQRCMYTCDGIDKDGKFDIDYSTYNLYYRSKSKVFDEIIALFRKTDELAIYALMDIVERKKDTFTYFDVISELRYIITSNIVIKNKFDIDCYLREKNNLYFLVDSISAGDDFLSSVYARKPIVSNHSTFDDAIVQTYIDSINRGENIEYCFDRLPISYRREFIESLIERRDELSTRTERILFNHVLPSIQQPGFNSYTIGGATIELEAGEWVVSQKEVPQKQRTPTTKTTATAQPDYAKILMDMNKEVDFPEFSEREILPTDRYIGLYNRSNGIFCIRTIVPGETKDTRKTKTGQNCMTIDKGKLYPIILNQKLPYKEPAESTDIDTEVGQILLGNKISDIKLSDLSLDEKKIILTYNYRSKKDICAEIFKKMVENNKVFLSSSCGVTGAIKKK